MWKSIYKFEVQHHLRQPLFWATSGLFFLMIFFGTATNAVTIGGAVGNTNRNGNFVILQFLLVMSIVGLFSVTAFVGSAAQRDFEHRTHELFFSKPVGKFDYLFGRFTGSLTVAFLTYIGCVLGSILGSFMPWVDPERVGPFTFAPYIYGMLMIVLPNLIFMGAVFFALASWTRSMMATYLGVVGIFVLYVISQVLLGDVENDTLTSMVDPFGAGAFFMATKYWTIIERNTALPDWGGVMLYNRLLWSALGGAILVGLYLTFDPSRSKKNAGKTLRERLARIFRRGDRSPGSVPAETMPATTRTFDNATVWSQFVRQTRFEVAAIFRSVPFVVMMAFGLFNVIGGASFTNNFYGLEVYPVTHLMLQAIQGSYLFLLVIIVTFYGGEIVWRERSQKMSDVYDSMPVPNAVYLGGKMIALLLAAGAFFVVGIFATIGYQLYKGYTNLEPALYAKGFLVNIYPFLLLAVLAMAVQVLSKNKFIGYMVMILAMISAIVLNALDYQHNLYRYAGAPGIPYSDMNGYGHFTTPFVWFQAYWSFFALGLIVLMVAFWRRGTETDWKPRLQLAKDRFQGRLRLAAAAVLTAFIATGCWIFYNTNILNAYVPNDVFEERQVAYEKQYRQHKNVPLPRITDVYADVDIFPYQRRVEIRGRYTMVNKTAAPIRDLHFNLPTDAEVNSIEFPPYSVELADEKLGYYIYKLDDALAPGSEMEVTFDITVDRPGFRNHGSDTRIVYNGTFFNNRHFLPTFGYLENNELGDPNERRKQGLPPVHRFPKRDDMVARGNTYIGQDADWIDFETVVSTSDDQIAIAPGYLQKEWKENGRRFFHYKMDAPILPFFAYLSGRYEVTRDQHGDVAIEIYHHPDHTYNTDRMIRSIKASIDYFEENFSPYQHRQARIIEFPRYDSFAQAFPNTIPFSEAIGFIARVDEEGADEDGVVDMPFYVTAHEIAHQWWAHQVIGGYVQGATLMSETMSQYSAIMVMEKEYGKDDIRRFLKYELDQYLRNRGGELVEETPLALVENQGYIHYRKGSLNTYALRDQMGEAAFNEAMRKYVAATAFQEPPFTTSEEWLDFVRAEAPDDLQPLITDLFEKITLYDNRIQETSYEERPDGTYLVTMKAQAKKFYADGHGVETETPIDDWIDVAVFGEEEVDGRKKQKVLFMEKRRINAAEPTFEVVVQEKPVRVGIDPYHKLVDRNIDDNVKRVTDS